LVSCRVIFILRFFFEDPFPDSAPCSRLSLFSQDPVPFPKPLFLHHLMHFGCMAFHPPLLPTLLRTFLFPRFLFRICSFPEFLIPFAWDPPSFNIIFVLFSDIFVFACPSFMFLTPAESRTAPLLRRIFPSPFPSPSRVEVVPPTVFFLWLILSVLRPLMRVSRANKNRSVLLPSRKVFSLFALFILA